MEDIVSRELEYRREMWAKLLVEGGPNRVSPTILRDIGIYGGAQGIWVDKARTGQLTEDGTGITVSLLHTGRSYPDDLSEDGVLYHYPNTNRLGGRDLSEISATKAAGRLGLPVFVIVFPSPASTKRDIQMGWIEGWDDESELFLVTFGDTPPSELLEEAQEGQPFQLVEERISSIREIAVRQGQQRFKLQVFQRYGPSCVVCGMTVRELLEAAHIRPKRLRGSDDPRNGIVLCANHHRAFDKELFAIEPDTHEIHCGSSGPDRDTLGLSFANLEHLPRKPHPDALSWHWNKWKEN